jgi:pyruvate ferredoxin oxidoreductase gamma subunit
MSLITVSPILPLEIRWHGRGGQGVMTASRLLATAAMKSGLYSQSLPDFGAERSGAPVAAYTRLDTKPPVMRGPVSSPGAVVIFDLSVIAAVDVLAGITGSGVVVVNTAHSPEIVASVLKAESLLVCTVDGDAISARLLGRRLPNAPVLGALLRALPLPAVDLGTLTKTMRDEMGQSFSPEIVEANVSALQEGHTAARFGGAV